ncbi:MAG: 16S rRNA (cytosine(967)-C(5))-methyltransferase, partial [Vulcanococcus sp.]
LLQRQLLEGLLPLLKPHGRLVYATCTVHPRENHQLIDAVVADHPELQLQHSWQLWPGELAGAGDGFFAAVLEHQP